LFIKRTPFDVPICLIAAILLVSSVLSKNRHLSFWGDYTVLTNSFIAAIFYILFYFLVFNNVNSLKQVSRLISVAVVSAVLAILYFVNQVFGIISLANLPVPRWTVTSDLPTHLGYFLAVVLVLGLAMMTAKEERRFWNKKNIFGLAAVIIIFAAFVILGFKSVWLIVAIAIFLFLVFALSRIEETNVPWVSVSFAILVVAILLVLLGTPKFLTAKNLPTEIALSPSISWKITSSALSEDLRTFLFGSGPSTFVYSFSAFRPEIFNNNFAWSLRFSKPYNAALETLATTGVLGAIGWVMFFMVALGVFFVTWFTRSVHPKKGIAEKFSDLVHSADWQGDAYAHNLFTGLATGWLTLFVSMFLITFTTVHWVYFFLLLALSLLVGMGLSKSKKDTLEISLKTLPQYTLIASFVYILIFALLFVLGVFLSRFYIAEIHKARAMKYTSVSNHTKAAASLFKAVSLNPNYSKYYLDLASSYIGMAIVESQKSSPNQQTIANLVASAVNQAREATRLAPNDAAAWDFLAAMYATARPLSANANSFVISALDRAIQLEKTNPRLYLELGRAKVAQKDFKGARDAFERAVSLKTNYVLGYLVISQLDELENKANEAIEHMSVAAALSPNDPTLLFNLGRLYYNRAKSDDLIRAEQLFLLAISVNPSYSDALWSLGILYERQGKVSAALSLYRQVEKLNPDNQEVKKKIQRLLTGG
jgi:tetratricopeptide (TPR) repeat protein